MILAAMTLAIHLDAFLCDSSQHALDFASALAQGESEEMAKDLVGRNAKREVCGLYRGDAEIEDEKVVLEGGLAYKVTRIRFVKDSRVAWLAERTFAPPELASEQHI